MHSRSCPRHISLWIYITLKHFASRDSVKYLYTANFNYSVIGWAEPCRLRIKDYLSTIILKQSSIKELRFLFWRIVSRILLHFLQCNTHTPFVLLNLLFGSLVQSCIRLQTIELFFEIHFKVFRTLITVCSI